MRNAWREVISAQTWRGALHSSVPRHNHAALLSNTALIVLTYLAELACLATQASSCVTDLALHINLSPSSESSMIPHLHHRCPGLPRLSATQLAVPPQAKIGDSLHNLDYPLLCHTLTNQTAWICSPIPISNTYCFIAAQFGAGDNVPYTYTSCPYNSCLQVLRLSFLGSPYFWPGTGRSVSIAKDCHAASVGTNANHSAARRIDPRCWPGCQVPSATSQLWLPDQHHL